jgi:UDP-glucose:(heptosyl)LPS alpha-1,3-glucosyltransferase
MPCIGVVAGEQMRIALLTRRFDPHGGGTERDVLVSAECIARGSHEVRIYANEVRGESQRFNITQVGGFGLGRTAALARFAFGAATRARRDGAELVLSFARVVDADVLRSGGGAHQSYLRAARQWRGERGARLMNLRPIHRLQVLAERRAFASPCLRKVIAVSELVRSDLMREFQISGDKVVTLYNGVDTDRFTISPGLTRRVAVRESLGLDPRATVVMFVGNGFARKGLGFLIDALARVKNEAHLLVVGADQTMRDFRNRAAERGVAARVHFLGARADVPQLFWAADALALPSLFEPFGNVIMEALASGLPVLASRQCGASELLPDEMREFVVADPTDVEELAARLDALLETGADLATVARETAKHHTWQRYASGLLELIASLE